MATTFGTFTGTATEEELPEPQAAFEKDKDGRNWIVVKYACRKEPKLSSTGKTRSLVKEGWPTKTALAVNGLQVSISLSAHIPAK